MPQQGKVNSIVQRTMPEDPSINISPPSGGA